MSIASHVNHSHEAIGVGYNGLTQKVYWSAIKDGHEGILTCRIDGSAKEYVLKDNTLAMIEDISVDYLGQNIYFTESQHKFIGVVGIESSKEYAVLFKNLDKPRGIVVYPEKALLFYTDWGSSPAVVRANMNGSGQTRIVTTDLEWPNGIAVDIAHDRIYWSDAHLNTLESSKMDGSDRRIVVAAVAKHPFSLAVFEDTLYWSDWQSREIQSCNKYNGKNLTTLVKEAKVIPYGIFIHHPLLEPFNSNPCANNWCSHICLLAPFGNYECKCPENLILAKDQLKCISPPATPAPRSIGSIDPSRASADKARTSTSSTTTSSTPKPINPRILLPFNNKDEEEEEVRRQQPVATTGKTTTTTATTSPPLPSTARTSSTPAAVPPEKKNSAVYDKDWVEKTPIDDSGSDEEGLIVGLVVLFILVLLIVLAIFYFIKRRYVREFTLYKWML